MCLSLSLTFSHTFTHTLTHPHILSHSHTLSRTHTLSHSHTSTHIHTLSHTSKVVECFEKMVERGACVMTRALPTGNTYLHLASEYGLQEVCAPISLPLSLTLALPSLSLSITHSPLLLPPLSFSLFLPPRSLSSSYTSIVSIQTFATSHPILLFIWQRSVGRSH